MDIGLTLNFRCFGGSKTAVFPPKTMKTMIRKTIASFVNILSVSGELL